MSRTLYEYYKSHGICPECGQNKAVEGHVYCVTCAEAQAVCNMIRRARMTPEEKAEEYQKRQPRRKMLYQKRKAQGLCVSCGRPTEGKTRCRRCAEKMNEQQRIRDRRR